MAFNVENLEVSQNRVFYYGQELKSSEFNRVFSKTFPTGIYEGGTFTYLDANTFTIDPFSVIIEDRKDRDIAVRIRTTQTLNVTIENSLSQPLIVARFEWQEGMESYLDIRQVSETIGGDTLERNPNDIILGKLNLIDDGGAIVLNQDSPFDMTRKQVSPLVNEILKDRFMVRAPKTGENQKKVYIEGGIVRTKNGVVTVTGGLYPATDIPDTSSERTDYLYVDENGNIQIEIGVSGSSSPQPYYGRKVLAEIRRGASRTSIRGSEIFHIHNEPLGTLKASTLLTDNASDYYNGTSVTIEQALDQAWEKAVRQLIDEDSKTFRHADGTRFEQTASAEGIILKGRATGSARQVTIQPLALTANRTLFLADGNTTLTAGTMVTKETDQTISGRKIFENNAGTSFRRASGKDTFVLLGRDSGTESRQVVITTSEALSADRFVKFPNEDVTFLKGTQVTTADENQMIAGVKEFSSLPKIPTSTPSNNQNPISKSYYDTHTVKNSSTQTITGLKTFREPEGTRFEQEETKDAIVLKGRTDGISSYQVTITPVRLSDNRGLTLADGDTTLVTGTMATTDTQQTLTGHKTFKHTDGLKILRADNKDSFIIVPKDVGTTGKNMTITTSHALSADRTIKFPNEDVTFLAGTQVTTADIAQTINGVKTFAEIPVLPIDEPNNDNQAVRKAYVDAVNLTTTNHIANDITDINTVHGIKMGSSSTGGNINADKVDGADKSDDENLTDASVNKIPTERAVKTYVDEGVVVDLSDHIAETSVGTHGATVSADVETIIIRDGQGKAKIADPDKDLEIANKRYVDKVEATLNSHTGSNITEANTVHGIKMGPSTAGGNINADKLDGEHGDFYKNADNLTGGTVDADRLEGTYTINITGKADTAGTAEEAVKLVTPIALNGENFDGSEGITIPVHVSTTTSAEEHSVVFTPNGSGDESAKTNSNIVVIPNTGTLKVSGLSLTSSREKKKAIENYEKSGVDLISSLQIVSFVYKEDPTEQTHIGIIAEDSPEEFLSPDGKAVSLADSVGVLLKAVQDLTKRVKELENKVD